MKFTAVTRTPDVLQRVITCLDRVGHKACVVQISEDKIKFACIPALGASSSSSMQAWAELPSAPGIVFERFLVVSKRNNTISFVVPIAHLAKALKRSSHAIWVKLKLAKKCLGGDGSGGATSPVLSLSMCLNVGETEANLVHDLPITLDNRRPAKWDTPPVLPTPDAMVLLPPLSILKRAVERLRPLSAYVDLQIVPVGRGSGGGNGNGNGNIINGNIINGNGNGATGDAAFVVKVDERKARVKTTFKVKEVPGAAGSSSQGSGTSGSGRIGETSGEPSGERSGGRRETHASQNQSQVQTQQSDMDGTHGGGLGGGMIMSAASNVSINSTTNVATPGTMTMTGTMGTSSQSDPHFTHSSPFTAATQRMRGCMARLANRDFIKALGCANLGPHNVVCCIVAGHGVLIRAVLETIHITYYLSIMASDDGDDDEEEYGSGIVIESGGV